MIALGMVELVPKGEVLAQELITMRRAIDQLEVRYSRLAAEFAQSEWWDYEGFNSAYDWLRLNCHMTSNSAWTALAVGAREADLDQSLDAMDSGEIGYAHVGVMARTAQRVGKSFDETKLLPLARKHSPGKFHYKVQHYLHSLDAKRYTEDQESLAEGRSLRMSTAEDGCLLLNGVLDPIGGVAVRTAIEALAKPSGEHDDRTLEQRNADAVVELASGGKQANLQVTATVETLKGLAGAAAGEMELSLPVSSVTVQRLACDCSVTRVLLSQESLVIDVGRSRRVVDGALRKALAIRDKHCQWPGCERPASWCDGHHLVHWIDGGETNLDNCVLLCKRHHRMVHEGQWKLVRVEGKVVSIAPTIMFELPRGPD
jgi:hypothetical protein